LPSKRAGRRLQDILDNIDLIAQYTRGMDERAFVKNSLVADAVERCLSRISEAARKLGASATTLVPDQPWGKIRGLGNRLRHDYDKVRRSILWEIVTDELPSLRKACRKALEALQSK
jgi:uncharacterized protein with HEPN domain